jgi:hypothetical protein
MAQITPMFAVPMVSRHLEDCAALNAELEALFLAREAEGDRYRHPEPLVESRGLFESNFRLFDWPHDCVRRLRDFCWSTLYGAIGDLNGYDDPTLLRLQMADESWFHITRGGGYFGVHNHALHAWSGVYCVRHDGDDPTSPSGRLSFIHPHAAASSYVDMSTFKLRRPYAIGHLNLRLQAGELLLFPSWLQHHVLPYEGNTHRITVAFNARFAMAGVEPRQVPLG